MNAAELLEAEFLVELGGLEIEGIQGDGAAAFFAGVLLDEVHEFGAVALVAEFVGEPKGVNGETAKEGVAEDSADDGAVLVFHDYGERQVTIMLGELPLVGVVAGPLTQGGTDFTAFGGVGVVADGDGWLWVGHVGDSLGAGVAEDLGYGEEFAVALGGVGEGLVIGEGGADLVWAEDVADRE